ncbi:MAG: sn-glycerol-3-phosphate ABC transporter ATP-binding protein UgpC [Desulfarculaceae bacterium]|jgi:sn-glycerol 3-phosphate transport system ATP-binding protein
MAEIALRGLCKSFGKVEVLHDINARIPEGGFVAVVGPSGCGKSTILRLIAGLEWVTRGEVLIGGEVVNRMEPKDRNIAMVFQNYALYPHMSVFDNMAYGLKVRHMPRIEIKKRVAETAEILGLADLLQRRPRQLSGGQRQRVAMGRAIVRKPRVFLFDEPLSNLDAKLRNQMRVEIKRLHRKLKTTSVYVTHDQVEAMTLADQILVLRQGRVEQIDSPQRIYHAPETAFVAKFFGSPSMNLFPGVLGEDQAHLTLKSGASLVLPAPVEASPGSAVLVGVRPEHLGIGKGNGDKGPGCEILAQISILEPLGSDKVIHCQINGAGQDLVTARLPGDAQVGEGDQISLSLSAKDLHLFNPHNERRYRSKPTA